MNKLTNSVILSEVENMNEIKIFVRRKKLDRIDEIRIPNFKNIIIEPDNYIVGEYEYTENNEIIKKVETWKIGWSDIVRIEIRGIIKNE